MKCRGPRISDEIEVATLCAMTDALEGADSRFSTSCDGCGAPVLRSHWICSKFRSDYCQVCLVTGKADASLRKASERDWGDGLD